MRSRPTFLRSRNNTTTTPRKLSNPKQADHFNKKIKKKKNNNKAWVRRRAMKRFLLRQFVNKSDNITLDMTKDLLMDVPRQLVSKRKEIQTEKTNDDSLFKRMDLDDGNSIHDSSSSEEDFESAVTLSKAAKRNRKSTQNDNNYVKKEMIHGINKKGNQNIHKLTNENRKPKKKREFTMTWEVEDSIETTATATSLPSGKPPLLDSHLGIASLEGDSLGNMPLLDPANNKSEIGIYDPSPSGRYYAKDLPSTFLYQPNVRFHRMYERKKMEYFRLARERNIITAWMESVADDLTQLENIASDREQLLLEAEARGKMPSLSLRSSHQLTRKFKQSLTTSVNCEDDPLNKVREMINNKKSHLLSMRNDPNQINELSTNIDKNYYNYSDSAGIHVEPPLKANVCGMLDQRSRTKFNESDDKHAGETRRASYGERKCKKAEGKAKKTGHERRCFEDEIDFDDESIMENKTSRKKKQSDPARISNLDKSESRKLQNRKVPGKLNNKRSRNVSENDRREPAKKAKKSFSSNYLEDTDTDGSDFESEKQLQKNKVLNKRRLRVTGKNGENNKTDSAFKFSYIDQDSDLSSYQYESSESSVSSESELKDRSHSSSEDEKPELSEYERLRAKKIARNEAKLAELGLNVGARTFMNSDGSSNIDSTLKVNHTSSNKHGNPNKRESANITQESTTLSNIITPDKVSKNVNLKGYGGVFGAIGSIQESSKKTSKLSDRKKIITEKKKSKLRRYFPSSFTEGTFSSLERSTDPCSACGNCPGCNANDCGTCQNCLSKANGCSKKVCFRAKTFKNN